MQMIPVNKLVFGYDPDNVRGVGLCDLTKSIVDRGYLPNNEINVIQKDDVYLVLNGRRRAKAAITVGLKEIPAIVYKNLSDLEILSMQVKSGSPKD